MNQGRQFETIIAEIFERHGFRVTRNAGSARPRQTDLQAKSGDTSILVEVKSIKRKIDVSHVDEIRARLNRVPADIIGAIFAGSDYTPNAIREIEASRSREILAFGPSEITALSEGRANLMELVERKREALRTRGKVWFYKPLRLTHDKGGLPHSSEHFTMGNKSVPFVTSRTENADVLFVRKLPETGWGSLGGEGTALTLQLDLETVEDLQGILALLHEKLGLSDVGSFSIQQTDVGWFGVGVRPFVDAASDWKRRYDECSAKSFHHSEDLCYFGSLHEGWLRISTRQRVWPSSERKAKLHGSELVIQLSGVPVDMAPFLQLCKFTNNQYARFAHVSTRTACLRRLKKEITLDVKGEIVRVHGDVRGAQQGEVTGIVAVNPFFHTATLPKELRDDEYSAFPLINSVELLVCDLSDWHDVGDVIDEYVLLGLEAGWANDTPIIRPFATWKNVLKRTRQGSSGDALLELRRRVEKDEQKQVWLKSLKPQKTKRV